MNPTADGILWLIGQNNRSVTHRQEGDIHILSAIHQKTGERFIVRAAEYYDAVVQLAQQVGIDMGDG